MGASGNGEVTYDLFDKLLGSIHGLPDITSTKATTVQAISPMLGCTQMFIIQTYRQKEQGDTIFLQAVSKEGTIRLALPSSVADAIARQREALTGKSRSRAAKANMEVRMQRGEVPGFMKGKRR
jgi:hypothetical protein